MTKQTSSKHVGPFGDVEIMEDKRKKTGSKKELGENASKVNQKDRHLSQDRARYKIENDVKVQQYEARERLRRERYEREAVAAERFERQEEMEKWEREKARRAKYKPRKPPVGYRDPHEACRRSLPRQAKEEKRQEMRALMNCIAFSPEKTQEEEPREQKGRRERQKTAEEMDNSLSSDTTSDITDVTPRSSSSGCSSMSKQSVCPERVNGEGNERGGGKKEEVEDEEEEEEERKEKLKKENELNLKKSVGRGSEEDKRKDNQSNSAAEQEASRKLAEVKLEEMKYLQDAFEDLDVDEETSDFASSIISGLSEERRAKCNRKNMTFTNEQLREIERVNLILLKKIMNHRKPRAKPQCQPTPNRKTSAAINRARLEEKIERENKILLKKLQSAKGTTGTLSRKQSYY